MRASLLAVAKSIYYLFEYDSCQRQYRCWSVNRQYLSKRRGTLAIKFLWVLITYAKYQDTLYKENKTKLSISGCTYQELFFFFFRAKVLGHDNEVIAPGTVLRVYFFANDSRQHKYCSWRINRCLLHKQGSSSGNNYEY